MLRAGASRPLFLFCLWRGGGEARWSRGRYGLALEAGAAESIDIIAAPSIGPGSDLLPSCRITATASAPSALRSASGMLQLSALPVHSPSFDQRRTTL